MATSNASPKLKASPLTDQPSAPDLLDPSMSRPTTGAVSSGSGYVNIGTPEETVLETYFVMLSKFNFDRAKDQCEREREAKSGTGGNNWCEFMATLHRLASVEITYFSLSYMERSTWRFARREPLRTTYETLIQELKKVYEVYLHRRGGTDFSWERRMTELVSNVMEYAAAKRDMSEFYVHFDQLEGCHLDYKKMEKYLKDMNERYKDSFQHHYLKPIRSTFQREMSVLSDLLRAQQHIAEWQFLPAILAIQASHSKLSIWNGVVPLGTAVPHVHVSSHSDAGRRPGSRQNRSPRVHQTSPPPQATLPYLYRWICKFHAGLLAKFSLYFHRVLTEHASVYDMKHLSGKLDTDYISLLTSLIRQTSAICGCLVFDSNGLSEFKGPKYHFPDTPAPTLTGINSYPIMVSVPYDFDFHHHRPNIISTIIGKGQQLNSSPALASQHDEKLQCTYYFVAVEPRVTLVVLSARTRERDSKTTALLTGIASQLRNSELAALLRPSS